jgi:hypothetical protein
MLCGAAAPVPGIAMTRAVTSAIQKRFKGSGRFMQFSRG